jgi:hypothetical protein
MMKMSSQRGFHEVWYIKLNDPITQRALWLRFSVLSTGNGFKKVAEIWSIFFERSSNREIRKIALKQTFDINAFSRQDASAIKIDHCELSHNHTRGSIQSKGNSITWNLNFAPNRPTQFSATPHILTRTGLVKSTLDTVFEELSFTGTTQINDEEIHWNDAVGMQGHLKGPKAGSSWIWGHCNSFVNDQGQPADFIFEGLSTKAKFGPLPSPRLNSFFFHYRGKDYYFNTLKDVIYCRSKSTLNEWKFQADRGELSFRGHAHAEHKDFAGITLEDTNGSLLYCTNSKLSNLKILVYRNGKLESTFAANGTAALEVVSKTKNPYVPLLI